MIKFERNTISYYMAVSWKQLVVSGQDQFAQTPQVFYKELLKAYYPDSARKQVFDPCPVSPTFDGLGVKWQAHNFCNPPFNAISLWYSKALAEAAANGAHTVMLLPFRGHARYWHDLIFPTALSVTIWTSPVTFRPYRKALAAPIVTIEVGHRRWGPIAKTKNLVIQQVPLKLLSYYGLGFYPVKIVKDLEIGYGRFDLKLTASTETNLPDLTKTMSSSQNAFICIMSSPKAVLEIVEEHIRSVPGSAVCVMMIPQFTTSYFRALLPLLKGLIIVCPAITFGENKKKSFMGSVILRVGGKDMPTRRYVQFATWRKGTNLRD